MKILVAGTDGFVAKNFISQLSQKENVSVFFCDTNHGEEIFKAYGKNCDVIYVFLDSFSRELWLKCLKNVGNSCLVIGITKDHAEEYQKAFWNCCKEKKVFSCLYALPEVFGKWCKIEEENVVAQLCDRVISKRETVNIEKQSFYTLSFVDDVVEDLWKIAKKNSTLDRCDILEASVVYKVSGEEIINYFEKFSHIEHTLSVPDMTPNGLEKKLYSTYLSYLPPNRFSYPLMMHQDERGSFTEILKSVHGGQVSVNIAKPGIEKGNHWHHTKHEKFVVVSGKGRVRFRKYESEEIFEYPVSSDKMEVIEIPPGYTHSIVNDGNTDMVTLMWCNECFQPEKPDTFYERVDKYEQT